MDACVCRVTTGGAPAEPQSPPLGGGANGAACAQILVARCAQELAGLFVEPRPRDALGGP